MSYPTERQLDDMRPVTGNNPAERRKGGQIVSATEFNVLTTLLQLSHNHMRNNKEKHVSKNINAGYYEES